MNTRKRLTTIAVAAGIMLSGTAIAAAPANAARVDDCRALLNLADWNNRMYEWSRTFYGADSRQAQAYTRAGADAANFYAGNC